MMYASAQGFLNVIEMLYKAGANMEIVDLGSLFIAECGVGLYAVFHASYEFIDGEDAFGVARNQKTKDLIARLKEQGPPIAPVVEVAFDIWF
jgi:hypothetical protein